MTIAANLAPNPRLPNRCQLDLPNSASSRSDTGHLTVDNMSTCQPSINPHNCCTLEASVSINILAPSYVSSAHLSMMKM